MRLYERQPVLLRGFALLWPLLVACGCAGQPPASGRSSDRAHRDAGPVEPAPAEASRPQAQPGTTRDRPIALVNGAGIGWDVLGPQLAEAAGGEVLNDLIVEHLVEREFTRRGFGSADADVAAEEAHLLRSLVTAAGLQPENAEDVLARVRAERGLGPLRYAALLRRNAMLRRLVADDITVTDADVELAYRVRHGERVVPRLIVVKSAAEAVAARARLVGPEAPSFSTLAATLSIDPSRDRGGLLGSVSADDPVLPVAIRRALAALEPGTISPVIALDDAFALVTVERRIPADETPLARVAPGLRDEIALVRGRVAMDQLARRLLSEARITVFDPSVNWSWRQLPGADAVGGGAQGR